MTKPVAPKYTFNSEQQVNMPTDSELYTTQQTKLANITAQVKISSKMMCEKIKRKISFVIKVQAIVLR